MNNLTTAYVPSVLPFPTTGSAPRWPVVTAAATGAGGWRRGRGREAGHVAEAASVITGALKKKKKNYSAFLPLLEKGVLRKMPPQKGKERGKSHLREGDSLTTLRRSFARAARRRRPAPSPSGARRGAARAGVALVSAHRSPAWGRRLERELQLPGRGAGRHGWARGGAGRGGGGRAAAGRAGPPAAALPRRGGGGRASPLARSFPGAVRPRVLQAPPRFLARAAPPSGDGGGWGWRGRLAPVTQCRGPSHSLSPPAAAAAAE